MAFKNILVSIAVVAFATGSAYASPLDTTKSAVLLPRNGCYSGGESFVDAGFPAGDTTWITNACELLAQTYSPSLTKDQCVTGNNAADRVNLSVENTSDNDASLTEADCFNAIKREFGACATGSEQQYGSFHYVIDPNAGSC